jgi:hypothetical protein
MPQPHMLFREADSRLKLYPKRTNNVIAVATPYGSCRLFQLLFTGVDGFCSSFVVFLFLFHLLFISCYISFSIYSPQKVPLMDFFRFCILMPESEEYMLNSSSIDPDNGHCQIFLRRLPITSSLSSCICVRMRSSSDMSPFCTEPPS